MASKQLLIVALTIMLNALDGFDVLAIAFAAPGIVDEWGINRAQLGFVLSMELIGMAMGSILLGGVADRVGRRRTVLGCLVVMATGMFMATTVSDLVTLSVWRVITGIGIGGMIASISALAAEFSNARSKHLSVSLMTIGYPIGVVIGGTIAAQLLHSYDWRAVFYLGAAVTAMSIPLIYFMVPESVDWLTRKQPTGALEKINKTLKSFGHAGVASLPTITPETRKLSTRQIFAPDLLATTMLLTTAYFFQVMTFYFVVKWIPKIVVDMGFLPTDAGMVLVWTNVGGATGGALLGFLTLRYGVKQLTIGALLLTAIMVSLIGRSPADLGSLALISAGTGFASNSAVVGLYALFAHSFPTHVRASGTGFAIGIGRGGAILAPITAGILFEAGIPLSTVAMIMGSCALFGAAALSFLKVAPRESVGSA